MSSEMKPRTEDGLEEVKMEFGGHDVGCNYLDRDFDPDSITDIKLSPDELCKNVFEKLTPGTGLMKIKEEFDVDGNHCETHIKNIDEWNVGPEMNDMGIETKPCVPLYNLYPTNIKEEVNDPDPPVFSLASVVKSEFHSGAFNTQYFDHSSVIMQNLKTESEDVDGNCEDPLGGGDSVPLDETHETWTEGHTDEKIQTGVESKCRFCKESYFGGICKKCGLVPPVRIEDKMSPTGDKKKGHKCETCDKRFAKRYDVTIHMRTHTGEKPFKCETCGKCFNQRSNLNDHLRRHTGTKGHKCETCGNSFADNSALTKHKVCHTGVKEFKCEICGKCFARNSSLTSHKNTHSGEKPYLCEKCGKGFVDSSQLTRHKVYGHGEDPFECDTCGKCFKWRKFLTLHMITHV